MEKIWTRLPFAPTRKNILSLAAILILLIGMIVGVYLVGQRQIFKSKANVAAPAAPETSFTLSTQQTVQVGEETRVQVLVRSDIEAANLFTAKLKFPTDLLQVKQIITDSGGAGCQSRPACLDTTPRCAIPEPTGGWCPPQPSPSSSPLPSNCKEAPRQYPQCGANPGECDNAMGGFSAQHTVLVDKKVDGSCNVSYNCQDLGPRPGECGNAASPSPAATNNTISGTVSLGGTTKSNSRFFIKNWVEKIYDNNAGTISLTGGVPNPGFQTSKDAPPAVLADIVFVTKKEGTATISFTGDNGIYSNANNINILTIKKDVSLSIQKTSSPSTQAFETGLEAGEQHDTSRVSLVAESGVKWVRLNFVGSNWSEGSGDTTTFNTIINEYIKHNIKIIGVVGAQSVGGGYNRNDPGSFTQKFVDTTDTIVARFGDRVKVYELFNEPNDWAGGSSSQVPAQYFAQFLGRIYRQIKIVEGRKDISLNSGPIFTHDQDNGASYLTSTYSSGRESSDSLANWDQIKAESGSFPLDGIGYHIYVAQGMNDQPQVETKLKGNLDAISGVIDQVDPGKKLWITEFSWGTGQGRVTEDVQAANLKKAFGIFQNYPIVRMAMWFTLLDFDSNEWGLVRGDGVKKKAWDRLREITGVAKLPASATPTPTPSATSTGIQGDTNGDGNVSIIDLSVLFSKWGKKGSGVARADINNDGVVNVLDYSILSKTLIDRGVIK